LGYAVWVVEDACRGVNVQADDSANALRKIVAHGGQLVMTDTLIHQWDKEDRL
jgi:nicotinamidase-related amidase